MVHVDFRMYFPVTLGAINVLSRIPPAIFHTSVFRSHKLKPNKIQWDTNTCVWLICYIFRPIWTIIKQFPVVQ